MFLNAVMPFVETTPPAEGGAVMVPAVTTALGSVIEWIGTVLKAITGSGAMKDLWPLLAVGIAVSIVMLVVKVIKRFAWGA